VGPYTAATTGTHYILVTLYSDAGTTPGNSYDLDVGLVLSCVEDLYEDNDTLATASGVTAGLLTGLGICSGDDDYFSIWLGAGESISAELLFSDAEGDVDLALFDPNGIEVASSETLTDNEDIGPITATESGAWTVRASLWSDAGSFPGNTYNFDLTLPGCQDDINEPNGSSPTATSTGWTPYTATDLTLCSTSEVDWFSTYMIVGETMQIDLSFTDSDGDIDVELYGPPGPVWLDGSYSGDDYESITYVIPVSGDYYVRAYMYSDDLFPGQIYDISVSF
jgi:hypothetical protein